MDIYHSDSKIMARLQITSTRVARGWASGPMKQISNTGGVPRKKGASLANKSHTYQYQVPYARCKSLYGTWCTKPLDWYSPNGYSQYSEASVQMR